MRPIKFRARGVDGKWWYGEVNPTSEFRHVNLATFFTNLHADACLPETLGEFTGLKDKNGVEGYFDDLVQWGKAIYQIVWNEDEGIAWLRYIKGREVFYSLQIFQLKHSTIIGNIHMNPELLDV